MNKIILRNFISKQICNNIISTFNGSLGGVIKELPIIDQNNMSDKLYYSNRSPGLQYKYLTAGTVIDIISIVKEKLKDVTGEDFDGAITDFCLPVFKYTNNSEMVPHKDVEKTQETPKFQDMVAILMLTEPSKDFEKGEFYVNEHAICSENGKTVIDDFSTDRYYPKMNKGDVFIFDNTSQVHGVEKVNVHADQIGRFTCSFRTK